MLSYKINDLFKNVNCSTNNTIQIPADIDLCYCEINIKCGNIERNISSIIVKGDKISVSLNILNKIFDKFLSKEIIIKINTENLKSIKDLITLNQINIDYIWNSFGDFDFSSSISEYFSKDFYFCSNDCIKVPINFIDFSQLIKQSIDNCLNIHHYFFVKISFIIIDRNENNEFQCFFFDNKKTKVVLRKGFIHQRIFDIDKHYYYDDNIYFSQVLKLAAKTVEFPLLSSIVPFPVIHIRGPLRSGKGTLIEQASHFLGHCLIVLRASDLIGQTSAAIEKKFTRIISLVEIGNFISIHFEDFDGFFSVNSDQNNGRKYDLRTVRILTKILDLMSLIKNKEIFLFLSTVNSLPAEIDQYVTFRYDTKIMSENQRESIIKQYYPDDEDIVKDLVKLSIRTPKMELISALRTIGDTSNKIDKFKSIIAAGCDKDATVIDSVNWSDIGGLGEVIKEVLIIVKLTLSQHKPVNGYIVKKSGILLYGEPGTGKTLLAKAIASECNLNFISVKGPELLNMYVGQTEENVRSLFTRVRQMIPCLLFCDELDSIVPRRGFSGDSGGVMDRVVSQFALEIDSINYEEGMRIIIMGATNRPDLIDPALLRNGRFDKMFHIVGGLDKKNHLEILKSQTYKLNLGEDVNLESVVNMFPDKVMTGALIYGIVSTAIMNAIRRSIEMITKETVDETCDLIVTMEDFLKAIELTK